MEKYCCKIECGGEYSSGFFIASNLLLSSYHGIENHLDNNDEISCETPDKTVFKAKVVSSDNALDLAILQTLNDFEVDEFMHLCNSSIIANSPWSSYGFPLTEHGQIVGEPIDGIIKRQIPRNDEIVYDIDLYVSNISRHEKYKGFSGSPIVDKYSLVIGIVCYQSDMTLSGISVRKASVFLQEAGISLKKDQLDSFDFYSQDVFTGFEDPIKNICNGTKDNAISDKEPNMLLTSLEGRIYYPNKKKTLDELIQELRLNKDLNSRLWKGWIKFLTYISILKGNAADANSISITLTNLELTKIWKIPIKTTAIPIPIQIKFLFTEETQFIKISKAYVTDLKLNKKLEHNSCSVFNSIHDDFGIQSFTAEDKRRVITDIAHPNNSSFSVASKIDFGILSLAQLTHEVAKSVSLEEAINNLEKIFKDAIG